MHQYRNKYAGQTPKKKKKLHCYATLMSPSTPGLLLSVKKKKLQNERRKGLDTPPAQH